MVQGTFTFFITCQESLINMHTCKNLYFTLICLSGCFLPVVFNFVLHDRRKGPIWNVVMWTSLFLGQGVLTCLYSQEWYAQRYCPITEVNNVLVPNVLVHEE